MAEYIDCEAVIEHIQRVADGYKYIETPTASMINDINAIPAANVKPVVRGKWIWKKDKNWAGGGVSYCSICRYGFSDDGYHAVEEHFKFCPACGADMRGEKNDNG